jgi:hypothetical protein
MESLSIKIDTRSIGTVYDVIERRPLGTGFALLKPDWIVTARHVVVKDNLPRPELGMVLGGGIGYVDVKILVLHPILDLAVLQLQKPQVCERPFFPSYEEYSGSRGLFYIGYSPKKSSDNEDELVLAVSHISTYERLQLERKQGEVEDWITFEAPFVEGGNSGCPVLGEGGGVVAIVIQAYDLNGITYARATSIHPLLKGLVYWSNWTPKQVISNMKRIKGLFCDVCGFEIATVLKKESGRLQILNNPFKKLAIRVLDKEKKQGALICPVCGGETPTDLQFWTQF